MAVFQLYTSLAGTNGKAFGFCFEHDSADIDALVTRLAADRVITVTKLISVDDGRGRRMITGRETLALGVGAISTISIPSKAHWEPED